MSPIIKWEPMADAFEGMDKMFEDFFPTRMSKSFMPAVDVYETKDSVVVEAPLAGVNPEDVDVSIENDTLTLRGQTSKKSEVDEKNYYRKEVRSGSFYRNILLPAHVDGQNATAESLEGMLKITIPKKEPNKPKSIKIAVNNKKK